MPNIAALSLAGGQWRPGTRHDHELTVVTPGTVEGLPVGGDLVTA